MNDWSRRAVLGAMAATPLAATGALAATAWPSEPIRIVVPFAPGGSTDQVARLAAPGLQERLGVPVIVENRSGAAGSIGSDVVAKAKPDGHTWLLTFDSHAVMPVLVPMLPFDIIKDFAPVTQIGSVPYMIACKPDKPFRTMADVFTLAKTKGGVSFGSTGNGTLGHLVMLMMAQRAGAEMTHLPYRSGGLAVNDAVAGHVDMMIGSVALLAPHVEGGSLRPLLQLGEKRMPAFPGVPTAIDTGFDGVTAVAWWGVFGPSGVPAPIMQRFHDALVETYKQPKIAEQITGVNHAEMVLGSPQQLAGFVNAQITTWGGVARANGVKPD